MGLGGQGIGKPQRKYVEHDPLCIKKKKNLTLAVAWGREEEQFTQEGDWMAGTWVVAMIWRDKVDIFGRWS